MELLLGLVLGVILASMGWGVWLSKSDTKTINKAKKLFTVK
jgi:hypothetical protein|tara:strand:+ start:6606 stop:6728 length:123 start_codon:yes stop_codon:yes gene_type:complete